MFSNLCNYIFKYKESDADRALFTATSNRKFEDIQRLLEDDVSVNVRVKVGMI